MAEKKDLIEYLESYLSEGKIQGECMLNGDYKKGNRAYRRLQKILNIAKDRNAYEVESFYNAILRNAEDPNTITSCCADMLTLGINPEIARERLVKVSKDINIHPILKSNALLFLKEWDKGNIN